MIKFKRSAKFEVFAVGNTIENALYSLAETNNWGIIRNITLQPNEGAPCNWYVRFKSEGTSMKASGEYVTGGVIVTWWK